MNYILTKNLCMCILISSYIENNNDLKLCFFNFFFAFLFNLLFIVYLKDYNK
jgi:hypothetical protein